MTKPQTDAEEEMAALIVEVLNLEDVDPASIDPEAPLFGSGLGLDSIDALELALEIAKRFEVHIRAEDEKNREIFASLRSLTAHVSVRRAA